MLDRIYCDISTPKLHPRNLLEICTKMAPFTTTWGDMYTQIDGVATGVPLGVLFANFCMGILEDIIFKTTRETLLLL